MRKVTPKAILRAEMVRRDISYERLAEMLTAAGRPENVLNLRNKVARGRFTADFMLDALAVMGVEWIQVGTRA